MPSTPHLLRGHNGLVRGVLGEWEISAIYTMQFGRAFGVSGGNGNNNSGSNVNADRADLCLAPTCRCTREASSSG